jgi:hypothetical protein
MYNSPSLYFGNITSLSEIRYAASMGAKYLGLRIDEKTNEDIILELIKWVDAEYFILELCEGYTITPLKFKNQVKARGLSYDYLPAKEAHKVNLLFSVIRYNKDAPIAEFLKFLEENIEYLEGFVIDVQLLIDNPNLVKKFKNYQKKLILELNNLSEEAEKITKKAQPNCLLINGIGEESIGLYDFDFFEQAIEFHNKIS